MSVPRRRAGQASRAWLSGAVRAQSCRADLLTVHSCLAGSGARACGRVDSTAAADSREAGHVRRLDPARHLDQVAGPPVLPWSPPCGRAGQGPASGFPPSLGAGLLLAGLFRRLGGPAMSRRSLGFCGIGLLAYACQLGPRGAQVALGAPAAAAQLAAQLLEHLGAGLQRGAQFLTSPRRVGTRLREFPGARCGHLG